MSLTRESKLISMIGILNQDRGLLKSQMIHIKKVYIWKKVLYTFQCKKKFSESGVEYNEKHNDCIREQFHTIDLRSEIYLSPTTILLIMNHDSRRRCIRYSCGFFNGFE